MQTPAPCTSGDCSWSFSPRPAGARSLPSPGEPSSAAPASSPARTRGRSHVVALPSAPPGRASARPGTTQKPSWGDGHEAEAGRRVRQGVGEGAVWLIQGWEWTQPSPAKASSSDPFSELSSRHVLPEVLPVPTICSWHFLPLGQAGSGRAQGALAPSPTLSSSRSSAHWPTALCSLFLSGPGHPF